MAQPAVLTLGGISFLQREVPDTINFGGKQMMAVHRNLGGYRVIDAMGPDPSAISWSGHFFTIPSRISGTAAQRARAIDTLRQSGQQVTLTWGSFSYQVIVAQFSAIYKNEWEISYKITCNVVSDNGVQSYTPPSLDQIVNEDVDSINAIADGSPAAPATDGSATLTSAMTSALAAAVTAMTTAVGTGSLEDLTTTQLQPVVAAFQAAYTTIENSLVTATGIDLDASTGASVLDGISTLVNETTAVATESDQQLALAYLGRIIANLTDMTGA